MARSSSIKDGAASDEATTVSYNTKIFNREIAALRSEEENLLRQKNATRLREFKVNSLKKRPTAAAAADMLIKDYQVDDSSDIVNVDISVDLLGKNQQSQKNETTALPAFDNFDDSI